MNIRYPLYEGVYRILTEVSQMGRTDLVLFPDEIRGGSQSHAQADLNYVYPQPDAGERNIHHSGRG